MSLELYDSSVLEKIKLVFPNTVWADSDPLKQREKVAKDNLEENDKGYLTVRVPYLSIERPQTSIALTTFGSDPGIRTGFLGKDYVRTKLFPIDITYNFDIVSDSRKEVDAIWRELLQYFYEAPQIIINVEGKEYFFYLQLIETMSDPSTTEFSETGRLWRQQITCSIPQANLFFAQKTYPIKQIPIRSLEIPTEVEIPFGCPISDEM